MDLFTHVIFAYLLSFIIWGPAAPQYIAAGSLAGGLPDADILLFPLTRWFPSLHHRGAVHTVLGVTIIAVAGSFLVPYLPYFTHASTLLYFVAMEIGGLSHLALDGFTNYAVRPLLPFSGRPLRLNADVAVSLVTMTLTGVCLIVLILEHGTVPFGLWEETAWILRRGVRGVSPPPRRRSLEGRRLAASIRIRRSPPEYEPMEVAVARGDRDPHPLPHPLPQTLPGFRDDGLRPEP